METERTSADWNGILRVGFGRGLVVVGSVFCEWVQDSGREFLVFRFRVCNDGKYGNWRFRGSAVGFVVDLVLGFWKVHCGFGINYS